jgi:hypothetical protein
MVKLPKGFSGSIAGKTFSFKLIVIKGNPKLQQGEKMVSLPAGSYLGSQGEYRHEISVDKDEDCIIYVRTAGKYTVAPSETK